ncbi:hypothetical protein SUFG_00071 [Sulfitobacter phage phiCB2047-B]|uniref:Uncharacterized protein n=1 Tax=Sulfitobacter phage phiCB2047-B TaxID=754046 RepID=M4PN20_9CAUD|nr:hypothetical protein SUFG_00071 [Sulfitobacter phage phiCB2047-B]AGH07438.1 hypothetical protein SUFG_00071 [Sulfitobacter phage phiCB2047-B]
MGMFKSISTAISSTFDVVTKAATAAEETLDMGTSYVHHRSVAFKDTDMMQVATDHAKRQSDLKRELEEDDDAAEIFKDLMKKMQA